MPRSDLKFQKHVQIFVNIFFLTSELFTLMQLVSINTTTQMSLHFIILLSKIETFMGSLFYYLYNFLNSVLSTQRQLLK